MSLLIPLVAGIAVAESVDIPYSVVPYLLGGSALLLAVVIVVGWPRLHAARMLRTRWLVGMAVLITFMLGLASDVMRQEQVRVDWPAGRHAWRGVVVNAPHTTPKTWRIEMVLDSCGGGHRVMLSVMRSALEQKPQAGDALELKAEMKRPYNYFPKNAPNNYRDFDYAKWIERQGCAGQAFVARDVRRLDEEQAQQMRAELGLWQRVLLQALRLRTDLAGRYAALSLDEADASVLAALTLGDKSELTTEIRKPYAMTGASHVLALSGLHMSILMMFLWFLLRPLRVRRWSRWVSVVLCVLMAWCFVVLTGGSVSTVRAALMLSLVMLLGMRGEGFASVNNVVLAAFVILLVSPRSLWDTGFLLSFLCVFFICYFWPYFKERVILRSPRWSWWLWSFLYITVAAQAATLPVVACVFGRVPLLSLLINVVVVPCAYVLLIGALCFFLLQWFAPAASALGWVLAHTVEAMNGAVCRFASLPMASVEVQMGPLTACCLYPLMFTAFAWLYFRRRVYGWWTLLFAGLVLTLHLWAV